jgi:glutamate synthase (NADPH/NADH) large chain
VRMLMAELGYRKFDEMVGQRQMLDQKKLNEHAKSHGLNFSNLFFKPTPWPEDTIHHSVAQDHGLEAVLDRHLIAETKEAVEHGKHVRLDLSIRNSDRSTGGMLSGVIARRHGNAGLRDEAIHVKFKGTAGQSFGAFLAKGVTLELEGQANDYVGKGLSGGRIVVYPPQEARKLTPEASIIVGNTVLYGATAGECYFRGVAGERFGVRNSGAIAVVEGTGDHGCEYMTGGVIVVIGETGRNFAAGMSGGIAYVLDEGGTFAERCNLAMVELNPVAAEEEVMQRHLHSGGDLEHHGRVDVMSDMSRFDAERLHQLIVNHARYTGSSRARSILEDWEAYLPKFRKVMPVEYRRALAELAAQSGPAMLVAGE